MNGEDSLLVAVRSFQSMARRTNSLVLVFGVVLGIVIAPFAMVLIGYGGKELPAYLPSIIIVVGVFFFSDQFAFLVTKLRLRGNRDYADVLRYGRARFVNMDASDVRNLIEQAKARE